MQFEQVVIIIVKVNRPPFAWDARADFAQAQAKIYDPGKASGVVCFGNLEGDMVGGLGWHRIALHDRSFVTFALLRARFVDVAGI